MSTGVVRICCLSLTVCASGLYPLRLSQAQSSQTAIPDEAPVIPPSAFKSKENVGRFVDVAFETGLRSFSTAGGVIVDDFENNGLLDVVTSSFESCGSMHYFHNNGDGTFTDNTAKAGLSDQVGGLNIIQTDYNNDGCIDILVRRCQRRRKLKPTVVLMDSSLPGVGGLSATRQTAKSWMRALGFHKTAELVAYAIRKGIPASGEMPL